MRTVFTYENRAAILYKILGSSYRTITNLAMYRQRNGNTKRSERATTTFCTMYVLDASTSPFPISQHSTNPCPSFSNHPTANYHLVTSASNIIRAIAFFYQNRFCPRGQEFLRIQIEQCLGNVANNGSWVRLMDLERSMGRWMGQLRCPSQYSRRRRCRRNPHPLRLLGIRTRNCPVQAEILSSRAKGNACKEARPRREHTSRINDRGYLGKQYLEHRKTPVVGLERGEFRARPTATYADMVDPVVLPSSLLPNRSQRVLISPSG